MIEQIEKLSSEFELMRFMKRKGLLQGEVEVHQIRSKQVSNSRIAKLMSGLLSFRQCRSRERGLVEPAIQGLVPGIGAAKVCSLRAGVERKVVRIVDLIGTIAGTSGEAQIVRPDGRDGLAALHGRDAGNFPPAQDAIDHRVRIVHKMTATADRNFPEIAKREAMAQIRSD